MSWLTASIEGTFQVTEDESNITICAQMRGSKVCTQIFFLSSHLPLLVRSAVVVGVVLTHQKMTHFIMDFLIRTVDLYEVPNKLLQSFSNLQK